MILVLLIPLRKWCRLEQVITLSHLDKVAKLTLVSGLIIAYIYAMEFFIAWYSGDPYERWCLATGCSATPTGHGLDADRRQRVRDPTALVKKSART